MTDRGRSPVTEIVPTNRFEYKRAIAWCKARGLKPEYPFWKYRTFLYRRYCRRSHRESVENMRQVIAAFNRLNRHISTWRDLFVTDDGRVWVKCQNSTPSSEPEAKPNKP